MTNYWQQQKTNAQVSLIAGGVTGLIGFYFSLSWLTGIAGTLITVGAALYGPARRGELQAAKLRHLSNIAVDLAQQLRRRHR